MQVINGRNYYNAKSFNEICEALEKAQAVQVYIDCIGHTRNNNEQEAYKEALVEKYADRLKIEKNEGGHSYSYIYMLRYFAAGTQKA